MGKSPNTVSMRDEKERRDGVIDTGLPSDEPLALGLDDDTVLRLIGNRIEAGVNYWNSQLKLDSVRKEAEDYYVGNTYSEDDLYDFQVPYKNNRILTAVETLLPMITSQIPLPQVTEGQDTDASRELAHDFEDVLITCYEDMGVKAAITMAVRHILQGKRVAVLKYFFDPNDGELLPDGSRKGKIKIECVRPEKVVFDAEASDPDDIPLIAEYMTATIEELTIMFPNKKQAIFDFFGLKRGTRSQLNRKVGYQEVHFTYYEKGKPQEATAYQLSEKVLLGAKKNINFNYDLFKQLENGKYQKLNFFDAPKKPYILINHINLGRYVIDDTSLADQARPLQDILEKRGRQIVENADQAASGLVLNSNMISFEDAQKLIGDPSEKIMVDGDVREAAARLPYNVLPNYVINDKLDARGEIDNIFGANAPVRGESSNADTLGQEVLSQRANAGRLQTITNSIEMAAAKLYPAIAQMIKVFWDEDEIVRFTPTEGKTRFINWNSDKVEDGVKIRVKEGSAIPKDKSAKKNETIQMQASIDPLTLAEGMDMPNAKEVAKRIVFYKFFMDRYLTEVLGDDGTLVDPNALGDIQIMLDGTMPPIPDSPSKRYIDTLNNFMNSNGFKQQDPQIQQLVISFASGVNDKAKTGLGEPGNPISEQNPATPTESESEGTVPGTEAPAEGAPQPGDGQGLVGKIISRVKCMNPFKK